MSMHTRKVKTSIAKSAAAPAGASAPVQAGTSQKQPAVATGSRPGAEHPGRVTLQLVKPGAKNVCVAGSFNEWKPERTPLVRVGSDRWVGNLSVRPGRHEYLFVVDGQWLPDPNASETVENPYGGKNSVLTVSE